jgi:hypothetical protein
MLDIFCPVCDKICSALTPQLNSERKTHVGGNTQTPWHGHQRHVSQVWRGEEHSHIWVLVQE